jgi:restriction system protein
MPIPNYQALLFPVLRLAAQGGEHKFSTTVESLADEFALSVSERTELLASGAQTVFSSRVGWARTYLKQAGLLDSPRRGYFAISQRGLDFFNRHPADISMQSLQQFSEFKAFTKRKRAKKIEPNTSVFAPDFMAEETPEDILAAAHQLLMRNLQQEVLSTVKEMPPTFFENLVIDLLVKMGYGGNRQDAGRAIGKSGDGGIDGFIKQDRLGLDIIYLQAKRWETPVGRPELQKFAGALQGQKARKGVFITTSQFTREAKEYAQHLETKLILIDGQQLAELMVEYNIGVVANGCYEVKKLDLDYFEGG